MHLWYRFHIWAWFLISFESEWYRETGKLQTWKKLSSDCLVVCTCVLAWTEGQTSQQDRGVPYCVREILMFVITRAKGEGYIGQKRLLVKTCTYNVHTYVILSANCLTGLLWKGGRMVGLLSSWLLHIIIQFPCGLYRKQNYLDHCTDYIS